VVLTLEQRVAELEKIVYQLQQHLPQIELPNEEEELKQKIMRKLKKYDVPHHENDPIDELRRLNRDLTARLIAEAEAV